MSGKVFPLADNQAEAVAPQRSVWLSASAGTGKTQVLSARVLRLLLRPGVTPSQILCLTFTKAGAAEMAERVNAVLARWVRLPAISLASELKAIGAPVDPATQDRARTLFAAVLDCPGGGLRIDTIHAFSQWLLAAFPDEAGLIPGSRPMEDRDRDLLAHQVLSAMVADAEAAGDASVLGPLGLLSERMGPAEVPQWLMRCAAARDLWFGAGGWQPPMRERVLRLLGLPGDAGDESLAELCCEGVFDCAALDRVRAANAIWGTASAEKSLTAIDDFLSASGMGRVTAAGALETTLFTQKGEPKWLKNLEKCDADYSLHLEAVAASLATLRERKALLALADLVVPALELGRRFALAWDEAKTREGLIDFDDQIRRAADLLSNSAISAWIRYKLDRRFDHILVDEAQDTNAEQWDIVRALTDDFFSGEGQRPGVQRTLFVVGDYKQAIFGFQGTNPREFAAAREYYRQVIDALAANDASIYPLLPLGLGRSYRTSQPVLDFVDAAIAAIGPESFGLGAAETVESHVGYQRPGLVTMWQPVSARGDDLADEGPEDWLSEPEREMASRIAAKVSSWLRDGFPLSRDGGRNAGPGDVMVLVRKRRELAGLIVARLHAAGVPVAGVDRLRLGAPLGVKDLMAALRFAAQPLDDLSLASLLVSPLVGWSQDDLLAHGYRDKGVRLWDHLRRGETDLQRQTSAKLLDLLRIADFEPPQAMLRWMLVGPWQGRKGLVARLGAEVNDPIDELLNAASAYASTSTASLAGFIAWFEAGDGEIKRESESGGRLVRVMTVHGSKGLQAPIVILADAAGNPDASRTRGLALHEEVVGGGLRTVPLPSLRKEEHAGPIREAEAAAKAAEREEHWRLLYVAMTRAEEALFIGGALGKRETEPNENSWYARLSQVMTGEEIADPVWGARREWGSLPAPSVAAQRAAMPGPVAMPDWALVPIGPEPRPPRPLAPSSVGSEQGADPPLPPDAVRTAARRGVLMHRLLERLPDVAPAQRAASARTWLARQAADLAVEERDEMLAGALAVLEEPAFAHVFAPGALAEVPLAATVEGQVIAGTADRLLVEPGRITVVDFKTARRPPSSLAEMPESTLRQMAAYAAALEAIYPGREICAAVLYTHTPLLIAIPEDMLAARKAHFAPKSESFADRPVE